MQCHLCNRACDDGSGRQQWYVRKLPSKGTVDSPLYHIVLRGGTAAARPLLLSCASTESATFSWFSEITSWYTDDALNEVNLMPSDDGSGRQQWRLRQLAPNIYTITSVYNPRGQADRYLAAARRTRLVDMTNMSLEDGSRDRFWKVLRVDS